MAGLSQSLFEIIPVKLEIPKSEIEHLSKAEFKQLLKEAAVKLYEAKEAEFPEPEHIRELERIVLLRVIDRKWMDHLDDMEQLKQGIGLMAYGQRDPAVEYKIQGFEMFNDMIEGIKLKLLRLYIIFRLNRKLNVKRWQKLQEQTRMIQVLARLNTENLKRFIQMILVHVVQERSIKTVVDVRLNTTA